MNMFACLKFLNCLRLGNMSIGQDTTELLDEVVRDFRRLITRDDDDAAAALVSFGAIQDAIQIVNPQNIDMK